MPKNAIARARHRASTALSPSSAAALSLLVRGVAWGACDAVARSAAVMSGGGVERDQEPRSESGGVAWDEVGLVLG